MVRWRVLEMKDEFTVIPVSQMICQQAFTVSSKIASHLANTYALEHNYEHEKHDHDRAKFFSAVP